MWKVVIEVRPEWLWQKPKVVRDEIKTPCLEHAKRLKALFNGKYRTAEIIEAK